MSLDMDAMENELRAMGISTSDVTAANLQQIISHCLREYSRHRPQVRDTTLTTVASQKDYDFPSGATGIFAVLWNPSTIPTLWEPYWMELLEQMAGDGDFNHPSIIKAFCSNIDQYNRTWGGTWGTITNSSGVEKIRLTPAPEDAGSTVPVFYYANHSATSFPERDYGLLFQGVQAYCKQAVAFDKEKRAGFKAGSYQVTDNAGRWLGEQSSSEVDAWKFSMSGFGYAARS